MECFFWFRTQIGLYTNNHDSFWSTNILKNKDVISLVSFDSKGICFCLSHPWGNI